MISLYAAAALFMQTSPISSKNEVSQNGASEPVIRHLYPQVNKEACPVSPQMRTPQAPLPPPRLPPPAPPPPPPFSSLPHRGVGSCCRLSQQASLKRNRACISEDVVEMWDRLFHEKGGADVIICTDDGGTFLAHSSVLMSASPIFSSCIDKYKGRKRAVYSLRLRGVPSAAASAFIRLIYSSRFDTADMKKFVLHLLVLSHVYDTPFIKKLCTRELELGLLTVENVIDIFQLARLCDASRLSLMCLRLIIKDFKSVARTEGWRVMKEANPSLEQELLEAVVDADTKKQERARKMEEEKVYGQLRDAMEALVHICRDGCRTIGPHDRSFEGRQLGPCKFPACKGLESLVRHFAGCTIKVPGGCVHCKRMWQLLELHSRMCNEGETCRVPLCRHFKDKPKKDEAKWRLLVMKVMTAKRKTHVFSLATVSARLEEE
ncbi:hypothetical protein KP509_21G036100 [Ceratopteris richardii]|uniref:BTB/POZ and TAZ domain-containing protein 3 n=1 Tax=Ceratopteris richardii TaxID=49495 RepID=A0A8T2SC16_CERRI|nr:hypothetical protein KP509_21G036100 [Ceratopteris richardii]